MDAGHGRSGAVGGPGRFLRPPPEDGPQLTAFNADAAASLPGPEWLRDRRRSAVEAFGSTPLPTTSEEEWRYSRIGDLDLDRYEPVTSAPAEAPTLPERVESLIDAAGASTVVVVRDGLGVHVRAQDPAVVVRSLGAESGAAFGDGATADDAPPPHDASGALTGPTPMSLDDHGVVADAFAALNRAFSTPLLLDVPAGVRTGPILVVHWAATGGAATFPRTAIRVGESAEVDVIEVGVSADVDALTVPVTTIDVGAGAHVGYLHAQQLGPSVWQIGQQTSRVQRDATFTSTAVALGAGYGRVRTASSLVGPGGTARLLALYFGSGTRMVDFRTVQEHAAPKTTSELLFKGAVANRSQAVYTGLIRVDKGASGTNAFQTNRNLVLHEGARADSVPNLEIEDNDVRCSHASAVGPIAEDQRFYLASRGVPPEAGDRLITLGFLDEVLQRMGRARLADHLRLELVAELESAERLQSEQSASGQGA